MRRLFPIGVQSPASPVPMVIKLETTAPVTLTRRSSDASPRCRVEVAKSAKVFINGVERP